MKLSRRATAIVIVLLIVVGGGAYLYFPRGQSVSAAFAATLSILNTDITAQRGGNGDFSPALDGDLYKTGDVVKSSVNGRAVLTFFDGSTLTVDPGSLVRVTTLNRLDNGGIQVSIEQTLGRSWASVQKLKTPTSTAAVRGTSFETKVEQKPDGTFSVTYTADDGQLLVSANAGGTTTVTPNTDVQIDQNQPAPANPTPLPPQPTIRVTSTGPIGFTLIGPTGAQCGSAGNKAEIFGCLQSGDNIITIRNPDAGHYSILMTASAAAPNANLLVEALLGTNVVSTRPLAKALNLGDLVRSGFTYGVNPQSIGTFETPTLLTSICGAYGTGTIFSGGALQQRVDQMNAFAQANHNAGVGFVATEAELNAEIQRQLAASTGAPVTGATVTVDPSGLHFTGNVSTPIGAFTASGDASMGPTPDGKLGLHINSLSAGPIPGAILDQVRSSIEQSALGVSDGLPFKVTQVKLAKGCFAIMGTTR